MLRSEFDKGNEKCILQNNKTLLKEMKGDPKKWKGIPYNMGTKLISDFKAIPVQTPADFFL